VQLLADNGRQQRVNRPAAQQRVNLKSMLATSVVKSMLATSVDWAWYIAGYCFLKMAM
jgi:hypothetical protein